MSDISSEKFVKVQSVQSGDFNFSNNHIDFVIPQGTYDLSNSYVALNVLPGIVPFSSGSQEGLLPYVLTSSGLQDQESGYNSMFVRNSALVSDRLGRLEDIRNTNMIHYDLYQLTTSFEEKMKYNYLSTSPIPSSDNIIQPQFLKLPKTGNQTNIKADFSTPYEVQIGIKEFLRLGEMKQFNTAKMGDLRMKLELDFNKLQPLAYTNPNSPIDVNLAFGGNANRLLDDIPASSANVSSFNTKDFVLDLATSPYFVGQAVNITATGTGGAVNVDEDTTIAILIQNADGTLQIDVNDVIMTTTAGQTYTDITISAPNPPGDYFANFQLSTAELRLKKVADVPMDELTYLTITNESDNGNGLERYRNQYYLEPECVGFSMLNTQDDQSIVGRPTVLNLYRVVLDNVDVVGNRDVEKNSPLEHELTQKTLLNLGLPYKTSIPFNTQTKIKYIDQARGSGGVNQSQRFFIGSPTPQTQNRKVLDLSIEANAGENIGNLELFKFIVKSVKL